jgi:hypothetical protein
MLSEVFSTVYAFVVEVRNNSWRSSYSVLHMRSSQCTMLEDVSKMFGLCGIENKRDAFIAT